MGLESIFKKQTEGVKNKKNTYEYQPFQYHQPQMTKSEANNFPWLEFKKRMKPIGVVNLSGELECIAISKYVPWSPQDVSLFVGSEKKDINEIRDFSIKEGSNFLDLNFYLAKAVLDDQVNNQVNVSIGFNPEDFSPGNHSVRRLHSHIYVSDGLYVNSGLKKTEWLRLGKPDRLMFVEPLSNVYYDYILHLLNDGSLNEDILQSKIENKIGYISFVFKPKTKVKNIFSFVNNLYELCLREYNKIEYIFTDKSLSDRTERFILRGMGERNNLMKAYLNENAGLYSKDSQNILKKLSERVVEARSRKDYLSINSNGEIWAIKGFAGSFTFSFNKKEDGVKFYFSPRVLTTSGIEKTIFGEDRPTRIKRTSNAPSHSDKIVMENYLNSIKSAMKGYATSRVTINPHQKGDY